VNGGSKGKRLRNFLQDCDDATAVRTLAALWEHGYLARAASKDPVANAEARYQGLVNRLSGSPTPQPAAPGATAIAIDRQKLEKAKSDLLQITALTAQARGYAFEGFLKDLFDAFGFAAQELFRLRVEQIDCRFQLGNVSPRSQMAGATHSGRRVAHLSWQGRAEGSVDPRPLREQ